MVFETIDAGATAFEAGMDDAPVSTEAAVKADEALDRKLAELKLTDARLMAHVFEYRAILKDTTTLGRDMEAAFGGARSSASGQSTAAEYEALMTRARKITDAEERSARQFHTLCGDGRR